VQVAEALGGAAEGATEPGAPPTLVLPRSFARYPVPQQRFMVGRMLGRVMTDSECCDAGRAEPMDRRLVEMLLAALIRSADATFGAGVASAAILDDLVQRIKATIDHDTLKHARVAANACWEEEGARPAMDAWLRGCEIACLRVGLLCGGGLDSLAALRQRAGTELHQDVLRNVASFATSVEFARLRQQVGLAMKE